MARHHCRRAKSICWCFDFDGYSLAATVRTIIGQLISPSSALTPGISNIMPPKKFEQLFRFFHLNDNDKHVPYGQAGHDKLFKVRKLLDLLCPLFESEFEMHRACTIDEAMIPFNGRLRFKQYMKDKPTKWGIKVLVLADAPTGYVKRLQVYTGK